MSGRSAVVQKIHTSSTFEAWNNVVGRPLPKTTDDRRRLHALTVGQLSNMMQGLQPLRNRVPLRERDFLYTNPL